MATMSGVVLPGDSTVKHVEVDVPVPDRIVTHSYSLDQADEAYRAADQGAAGKVCHRLRLILDRNGCTI
jgi:threonine dehydrogenase-like Zn-dependent dehydrogenase